VESKCRTCSLQQFVLVSINQRRYVYCAIRAACINITELNFSPRWRDGHYLILIFICTLLLPEGNRAKSLNFPKSNAPSLIGQHWADECFIVCKGLRVRAEALGEHGIDWQYTSQVGSDVPIALFFARDATPRAVCV
jgi:hypothetical protein